jgi:hypothetical protein
MRNLPSQLLKWLYVAIPTQALTLCHTRLQLLWPHAYWHVIDADVGMDMGMAMDTNTDIHVESQESQAPADRDVVKHWDPYGIYNFVVAARSPPFLPNTADAHVVLPRHTTTVIQRAKT